MKSTRKYLARYAEPEAAIARELLSTEVNQSDWQYCLVIPAYKESPAFYQRLATTLCKHHKVLLIVVVNQPDSLASPHPDNTHLWRSLLTDTDQRQVLNNLHLRDIPRTNSALLLADRFHPEQAIPERKGVGLARKIGADIGLALIDSGHISTPWIYTSDADAHLPTAYFSALDDELRAQDETPSAAAIYPFKHRCDDTPVGRATRLYEQRMHQYVEGLERAGSPYAFQTIGSAIAVSAAHYAIVRGFPKRSGGEDFYLLNKLAKTGAINKLQAPQILIDARQSNRVPFGTGPAISQLLLETSSQQARIFYHPQIFIELQTWLDLIPESHTHPLNELALSASTLKALQAIGTVQAIEAARKISSSTESYRKHLNTWFDAFKTLKFIHQLREDRYPSIDIATLKAH